MRWMAAAWPQAGHYFSATSAWQLMQLVILFSGDARSFPVGIRHSNKNKQGLHPS